MARRSRPRPRRPGHAPAAAAAGPPPRAWARARAGLAALAARPLVLLAVLWGANAVLRPYAGLYHDARLYALLTRNWLDGGALAGDLFLRFGSQERYSIFTWMAGPLAAALGVEGAFFLLHVVSSVAFWWGALRLVRALVPEPAAATLGLLVAAVAPLTFGGLGIFHVHEPFLTPRLPANALVLLAMERLVAGRAGVAAALLAGAAALHPVMALAGVLVAAGWAALALWPTRAGRAAVIGAGIAGAAALAPPLGDRLFGSMDAAWLAAVRWATPSTLPLEWRPVDWVATALGLGVTAGAAVLLRRERPAAARLLALVVAAGVAGVALAVVAAAAPYTLLLQAQPHRVLWLAKALQWPLAALLAARLWRAGDLARRALAATLVATAGLTRATPGDVGIVLLLPVAVAVLWGLGLFPAAPRRRATALVAGAGLVLAALTALRLPLVLGAGGLLWFDFTPVEHVGNAVELAGPAPWIAAALVGLARLPASRGAAGVLALAAAAAGLAASLAVFAPWPRPEATAVAMARAHRLARPGVPMVYANWARADQLWIGLRAAVYFHPEQLAGAVFSRGMALEGRRRAGVVRALEANRYAVGRLIAADPAAYARLGVAVSPARPDDLVRLCADGVDVVLLRERFPGLYAATDGVVYLYDCGPARKA